MAEEIYVYDGAAWRNASHAAAAGFFVRHSGAWREPTEAFVYDGAAWRRWYVRGVLALSSANNVARNTKIAPYNGTAGYTWQTDGTLDRTEDDGSNQINSGSDWFRGGLVAADYEYNWQSIAGGMNNTSVPASTTVWTNMATQQRILQDGTSFGGDSPHTFSITIRQVTDTANSVTQDYTVWAGGLN